MSVTVNVVGQTAVSVSVAASTSVSVVASGGIGPAGFITVPGTSTQAFGTFQLQAGDGITVSTANGQFLISSYPSTAVSSLAPVQNVAGRTGAIVLQASDVTAGTFAIGRIPTIGYTALSGVPVEFTPVSHTHAASDVASGTLSIARIPTISYTALSNTPATFSPSAHTHSTTDVVSFTSAAAAAAPVQSVAGRSGAISLAVADVSGLAAVASSGSYTSLQNVPATFAPSAHTHGTADITGISSSFAAASHTHDAAAISSGVLDLARIPTIGYTALSGVPTTFAPQAHTHSTADVVGLTASFSQVGHTHDYAATIHTHSTADIAGYQGLPAQAGKLGPLITDGTAATWSTRYSIVDPVLVQGSGMTLTRDTSAGSITVAFAGGTSGVVVSSATPQPLGTASAGSSADAARADHVHLMPSAADVGAAAAGHSHEYVQVLNGLTGTIAISGGAGVTVSTASSSITISAGGGGGSGSIVTAATVPAFPATGSASNLYITTEDQRIWRWDATASIYVESGPIGGGFALASVPASASATGTAGQIAADGSHWYYCSAPNTWKRAALSAWLPVSTGLQLWLDASDASSLYDATSGGSLVAADGGVARWEDKSGNGRHATQATSGSRPLRKTNVQNGLGGLRFDGSDDFLTTATGYHTSDVTIFVVAKRSSGETRAIFQSGNSTGLGYTVADANTSSFDNCYARGVANGQVGSVSAGTSWRVISVTYTAGTRKVYIQGSLSDTESFTITAPNVANGIATWIGSADFAGSNLSGDIGEMIAYDTVLSDTARAAVEGYLISKWGIV